MDEQELDEQLRKSVEMTKQRKYQEAEKLLRDLLKNHPNHIVVLNNLGVILGKTKRRKEARTYLDKALQIDPKFKLARKNRRIYSKFYYPAVAVAIAVAMGIGYGIAQPSTRTINGFHKKGQFPSSMTPVLEAMSSSFHHPLMMQGVSIYGESVQLHVDGRVLSVTPDYVTLVLDNNGQLQINWFLKVKTQSFSASPAGTSTPQFVPLELGQIVIGWELKHPEYIAEFNVGYAFENASGVRLSTIDSSGQPSYWFIGTTPVGANNHFNTAAIQSWVQNT